jgi:hypothetical protein
MVLPSPMAPFPLFVLSKLSVFLEYLIGFELVIKDLLREHHPQ